MGEIVRVGGASTEHTEHWRAIEIVESNLKYTALGRQSTATTRDILQRLKDVIHTMRPVTESKTRANAEPAKWYL